MAMQPKNLLDLVTFTRASTATRTNASGVIESVSANVPRLDYDPVTLAPKGLLIEEQRTNLLRWSEGFDNASWANASPNVPAVVPNTTVAPDGTTTADTLTAATGGTASQARQNSGVTGATGNFTASVYLKGGTSTRTRILLADTTTVFTSVGDFQITWSAGVATIHSTTSGTASITYVGGGWYRCALTANVPSANAAAALAIYPDSLSGTGTVVAWGAQLEVGAFGTSYIPTAGSQATRAADQASIVSPNFSSWYNQNEGTFVVEAVSTVNIDTFVRAVVSASDASLSNRITAFLYNGKWGGSVRIGGVDQCDLQQAASYGAGVVGKIAFAYKADDFACSVNGNAALSDLTGALPTVDRLYIGSLTNTNSLNGHIRAIRYYPSRLPNAQLQALTA